MRQVLQQVVVAINFAELNRLQRAVRVIFREIRTIHGSDHTELEIKFLWDSQGGKEGGWITLVIKPAKHDLRLSSLTFEVPKGCGSQDWALLISGEVVNHLLSGFQYLVEDETGDTERGIFSIRFSRMLPT